MPGIVVFRRRWSVGSDDLVVPGAFLFLIHLAWILVLTVLLAILEWDLTTFCIQLLWDFILGYLVIFVFCMATELIICLISMRGSILDTAARAPIRYLLYVRLFLLFVETGWLCAGISWIVNFYETCPFDRVKVMLGLVISNCCVLATIIITVWCVYDPAGRSWVKMKKYQRSMREAESRSSKFHYKRSGSRNRNWRQRKVIRAYQNSWDNRCRILFCCMGNSDRNRNSFAEIAQLLSDFFRDLDVVPSDVVAGLVLLRKFQKIERELIIKQRKNDTYEFLSGVAITPRTKFLNLTEEGSDLSHFQAAIHYMHFALAAYGWPLYVVSRYNGICKLCPRLRCCSCFGSSDTNAVLVEDNCCQCNFAALKNCLPTNDVEVVYATFHVDVGETPFFVALDYDKKKVVLSIRGTLSMKDVMTDLNAEGEVLPLMPPRDDWLGHKGMVQAAEYIRRKLYEEGIIDKAFAWDPNRGTPDFGLVLVGHSLGAGTAAILAILLRQEYPDLVCFSFAPPGGLLSIPAQEYTQQFITSVVLGKDVVPRIGLRQMESLRADLINAIKRSVDPKWKTITCSLMCCGCVSMPTSAANLEAEGSISEYQKDKDLARSQTMVPSDTNIALTLHRPLYPPGKIMHIVRQHPNKLDKKQRTRWRQLMGKNEPVYLAIWAEPCDFDEVLISPVMIQDHMPDRILKALNKVMSALEVGVTHNVYASTGMSTAGSPKADLPETEVEQEMRALLSSQFANSPAKSCPKSISLGTPPHRLCLETSFTSLQSPTEFPHCTTREHSADFRDVPYEYVSLAGELLTDFHYYSRCNSDVSERQAPLATPETLSETSSSPPSPNPPIRGMRRTPKISGNLSTAADDLKNNLHFVKLAAKSYYPREDTIGSNSQGSSSGHSENSYDSATCSFAVSSLPPPVPRRDESSNILQRDYRVCTAACCRDDSENSSPCASSQSSRKHFPRSIKTDFENGSSGELCEPKTISSHRFANDVLVNVISTPEHKSLMTPATNLTGSEWKRTSSNLGSGGDASLPLLRGLSPTPTHSSPFFNAKRKKYIYPITLVGRGESSV